MPESNNDLIHPRNKKFYRYVIKLIHFTSTGKTTQWGYNQAGIVILLQSFIIPYVVPAILVLQLTYLLTHRDINFTMWGAIFSITFVTVLVQVAVISATFKSYNRLMENMMNKIHLFNFINGDLKINEIVIQTERNIKYTSYFLFGVLTVDWISWTFVPMYNNIVNIDYIKNKTMQYQTCIYLWAPFDYRYDIKKWAYIHLLNVYFIAVGCLIIICFTTASYIFIYLFIGHIKILKQKIQTYFLEDLKDSDVHERLVEIIKYHAFIIKLFKEMQSAFGFQITTTYLFNLIVDSVMLYLVMNGDKSNLLIFGLMILVYLGSMVLVSFVLEEIRYQSNTLSDAVYAVPWEKMTIANQRTLLMILRRMQPPFVFTAAGGLKTGVRPMVSILKSIFSYYVMLNSSVQSIK